MTKPLLSSQFSMTSITLIFFNLHFCLLPLTFLLTDSEYLLVLAQLTLTAIITVQRPFQVTEGHT